MEVVRVQANTTGRLEIRGVMRERDGCGGRSSGNVQGDDESGRSHSRSLSPSGPCEGGSDQR